VKTLLVLICTAVPAYAGCNGYAKCRYDENGGIHFNHGVVPCSVVRSKCLTKAQSGACEARYAACERTGCWNGPGFSGCGLVR
jgi:hypothetical protein